MGMDMNEKRALAARITELTMTGQMPPGPPGMALPEQLQAQVEKQFDEMTARRRVLMTELYAEYLSDEQLQALHAHHDAVISRAIAATMPAIQAEFQKRSKELWGKGQLSRATTTQSISGTGTVLHMSVVPGPPLDEKQEAALLRLVEQERFIETTHMHLVRNYLTALEHGATGTELARFYTRDAEQIEHPNRLNPQGGRSDLSTLLARAERGTQLLSAQRYEVLALSAMQQSVAAEVRWTGTLAVPLGSAPAGAELRAHIAMFFDMKDGLIHRQRNYDCFET